MEHLPYSIKLHSIMRTFSLIIACSEVCTGKDDILLRVTETGRSRTFCSLTDTYIIHINMDFYQGFLYLPKKSSTIELESGY